MRLDWRLHTKAVGESAERLVQNAGSIHAGRSADPAQKAGGATFDSTGASILNPPPKAPVERLVGELFTP